MSLESHLRQSVLRTALLHQIKNQNKAPERIARNVEELLSLLPSAAQKNCPEYQELLSAIKSCSSEEFITWVLNRFQ